jgi:hypothetical protein
LLPKADRHRRFAEFNQVGTPEWIGPIREVTARDPATRFKLVLRNISAANRSGARLAVFETGPQWMRQSIKASINNGVHFFVRSFVVIAKKYVLVNREHCPCGLIVGEGYP